MNKTLVLLRLHLSDLWGINRLRHSEDRRGRRRLIGAAILSVFLIPIFLLYIVGAAVGLAMLRLASYIPSVMALLSALIIVFTTFTKASDLLFGGNDQDILMALPVSGRAILASRILTIYIHQLPFFLLIMLPSLIVYAIFTHPYPYFYILALPLTLLFPLIPIIIAAIVGALLTWVGSHFRHKSLATAVLSMLLFTALILGPTFLTYRVSDVLQSSDLPEISDTLAVFLQTFTNIYPPSVWYADALVGNMVSSICFLLTSVFAFTLFLLILDHYGVALREAVVSKAHTGRRVCDADFRVSSVVRALYKKELKRLFSSSIYLVNTATGGLLVMIFSVLFFFVPVDTLFTSFGVLSSSSGTFITAVVAIFFSFPLAIMSTTSASISLEGRNVWILQTLPVSTSMILHVKSAVDLTVKLPCIIVAATLATIGLQLPFSACLAFLFVPAIYSLFSSQMGLLMDIRKPNYTWTNETQVVKQGISVLLTMLAGMAVIALPAIALFVLGTQYAAWILVGDCVILLVLTGSIHGKLIKARI